jgi:hypothetical protein
MASDGRMSAVEVPSLRERLIQCAENHGEHDIEGAMKAADWVG